MCWTKTRPCPRQPRLDKRPRLTATNSKPNSRSLSSPVLKPRTLLRFSWIPINYLLGINLRFAASQDLERRLTRKTEDLDLALKTRTSDRHERETAVAELSRMQFTVQSKEDDVKSLNSSVEHSQHELRDTRAKYEAINQKLQAVRLNSAVGR